MRFNPHYEVVGKHSFLSASKPSWVNYNEDKLNRAFFAHAAAARGTALHELAKDLITLGVKLPDLPITMNMYVNDAIGYRMEPEVVLYYSMNAFGTADTLSFRDNTLRVHDLKTGIGRCSFHQLEVYAAYFCLEYRFKPHDIIIEMRIYQNDAVQIQVADPDVVVHIMDRIITHDKQLNILREEIL